MKKNIFVLVLLFVSLVCWGQINDAEDVVLSPLIEFTNGSGEDMLNYFDVQVGGDPSGPPDFAIDDTGNFYIWDYWNKQIKIFDKHNNFVEAIPVFSSFITRLEYNSGYLYCMNSFGTAVTIFDVASGRIIELDGLYLDQYESRIVKNGFFIYQNLLVIEFQNFKDGFITVQLPEEEGEDTLFRDYDDSTVYIRELSGDAEQGLWINSEDILFYNGALLTGDENKHIRYWLSSRRQLNYDANVFYNDSDFYGIDKDGNSYWGFSKFILIFDNQGMLIKKMRTNISSYNRTPFHIDTQGNLYTLSFSKGKHIMYKLKRTW